MPPSIEAAIARLTPLSQKALTWLSSPQFYGQLGVAITALLVAWFLSGIVRRLASSQTSTPQGAFAGVSLFLSKLLPLTFPLLLVLSLGIAQKAAEQLTGHSSVLQIALGLGVVFLLRAFSKQFITNKAIIFLMNWIAVPAAVLQVFGWLDDITLWLEGISLSAGDIKLSAYTLLRTAVFGTFLFWLGRLSNDTGKRVIRDYKDLDTRSRELFSKLFEIILFIVGFLILLQIIGVPLTTLAVFGGAIGVGLGFGLQQIASNFISGIIILLDKSLTIGDYIELEDGRGGVIRELGLRCATVETFDGKDIVVPNETFITTSFTNWTHYDNKQRYSLTFGVAYETDLEALFDLVRDVVATHPQVLSGDDYTLEEQPDAEIDEFGDSGINILVEYWIIGVDDGKNRVDADLKLMIWKAMKENGFAMPFPQREVRILNANEMR